VHVERQNKEDRRNLFEKLGEKSYDFTLDELKKTNIWHITNYVKNEMRSRFSI
jgi:hypothetical protein